jgi:hypothetical protein
VLLITTTPPIGAVPDEHRRGHRALDEVSRDGRRAGPAAVVVHDDDLMSNECAPNGALATAQHVRALPFRDPFDGQRAQELRSGIPRIHGAAVGLREFPCVSRCELGHRARLGQAADRAGNFP